MITIRDVEISRFRSIRKACLENIQDFSVLAGLNNSGKSNFLRALNLFFSGRPEPGLNFSLSRDYYRPDISSKKKKTISVSVHFTLSDLFKFRRELSNAESLLSRDFIIKKEWSYKQTEPAVFLNEDRTPLGPADVETTNQFLNLISFRYIPNRVIPTEIIRHEQQALQDVLVRRLARFREQSEVIFDGLQSTAEGLVKTISNDVKAFAPDIQKVRLATASSLANLVFKFGYRLEEGGVEMDEDEQGSGMQSLLMFETLHLIDRDYFQQFGWKQSAIWVVEEPESSLNTALEAKTAHLLSRIAKERNGRLQIISTTHSDLMIQYANSGYFIEKQKNGTQGYETLASPRPTKDLLNIASNHGVSRWVNQLLLYPLDPVILVEGKYDRDFMLECFRINTVPNIPRIVCLADLKDDATQGGVDRLRSFIKENVQVIRARAAFAKVIVILDWDSASRVAEFSNAFQASEPFICMAWDVAEANPRLSETFRGIERYFPDRIIDSIKSVHPRLIFENDIGVRTMNPSGISRVKQLCNDEIKRGLQTGDDSFTREMIRRILQATR